MKRLSLLIIPIFAITLSYSQPISLKGKWTECFSFDSSEAFQCSRGFRTYVLDSAGNSILEDSVFCYPLKYAVTGKWNITGNRLEVSTNPNSCSSVSSGNVYIISWVNTDLFYSTYISRIEAPGKKSFTVFKRIK